MLALTSYEQSNGFSALNADELYFINGGSGNSNQTACAVVMFGCAIGAVLCPPAAPGLGIVAAGVGLAAYFDSQN